MLYAARMVFTILLTVTFREPIGCREVATRAINTVLEALARFLAELASYARAAGAKRRLGNHGDLLPFIAPGLRDATRAHARRVRLLARLQGPRCPLHLP